MEHRSYKLHTLVALLRLILVTNTKFGCHQSRICSRRCCKSLEDTLFRFWRSHTSETSRIALCDSKRIYFPHFPIFKVRMVWNTTPRKYLPVQSLWIVSVLHHWPYIKSQFIICVICHDLYKVVSKVFNTVTIWSIEDLML